MNRRAASIVLWTVFLLEISAFCAASQYMVRTLISTRQENVMASLELIRVQQELEWRRQEAYEVRMELHLLKQQVNEARRER